jgi:hypothetical protein
MDTIVLSQGSSDQGVKLLIRLHIQVKKEWRYISTLPIFVHGDDVDNFALKVNFKNSEASDVKCSEKLISFISARITRKSLLNLIWSHCFFSKGLNIESNFKNTVSHTGLKTFISKCIPNNKSQTSIYLKQKQIPFSQVAN